MSFLVQVVEKLLEAVLDIHLDKAARAEFLNAESKASILLRRYEMPPPINPNWSKEELLFEAIPTFRYAIGRDGKRTEKAEAAFKLGLCYEKLGWVQEAYEAYSEAVRYNKKHARAWSQLAQMQYALGLTNEAIKSLKKYLSLRPNDVDAKERLESWIK